jgi:hypothetical protein
MLIIRKNSSFNNFEVEEQIISICFSDSFNKREYCCRQSQKLLAFTNMSNVIFHDELEYILLS